jgi:hypothetical protein
MKMEMEGINKDVDPSETNLESRKAARDKLMTPGKPLKNKLA